MNGTNAPAPMKEELLAQADEANMPEEYAAVKRAIVRPEDEEAIIQSWAELLKALDAETSQISKRGSDMIPVVEFSELQNLSAAQKQTIRDTGSVIIRNVVDDEVAAKWKDDAKAYIKANPVLGLPADDVQFFELYWSKSQVASRSHPNVIAVQTFMNQLWSKPRSEETPVSLSQPLVYADRLRIRRPNAPKWMVHKPHIDGARVDRWADDHLRSCFTEILQGNWQAHDPYRIDGRIAPISKHKLEGQTTMFRSWQGWLAMADISPGQGTLQVFPNVKLSNAYVMLRPFFKLKSTTLDPLLPSSWKFDTSTAHFPAMQLRRSMRLNDATHPSLRLDESMVSIPRVKPGDMVFWHCDVIHAVEEEHNGPDDSAVIYIPAVPLTPWNASYVARQRDAFLSGAVPPDFHGPGEKTFVGRATESDINGIEGRRAMGFEGFTVADGMTEGEQEVLKEASRLVAL